MRLAPQLVRQALMPVVVLIAWAGVLVWLIASLTETAGWVDHTDRVIADIGKLESEVYRRIGGVRGFLLTRDDAFLTDYRDPQQITTLAARLQTLVGDNPPQQARVAALRQLFDDWQDAAAQEIAVARAGRDPADLLRRTGDPLERQMRGRLLEMREVEERLRTERLARASRMRDVTLVSTTALGVTIAGLLSLVGVRGVRRVAADYEAAQGALRQEAERLEQRVAERTAELAGANAQLEAFGYSISHDLRAPLRGMQGLAQALVEDCGDRLGETGRDYTRRISAEASLMDTLINDLLAYSRLTRVGLATEDVPVRSAVEESVQLVRDVIERARARIDVSVPDVLVRANRSVLVQVLSNLVTNAVKFGGAAPKVGITAVAAGSEVTISVSDDGIGIAPEYHDRIFGVFERLHSAEQYPGTGIGLAVVKKGVERMGGRVGVASAPGSGSRFWFTLPAGADA